MKNIPKKRKIIISVCCGLLALAIFLLPLIPTTKVSADTDASVSNKYQHNMILELEYTVPSLARYSTFNTLMFNDIKDLDLVSNFVEGKLGYRFMSSNLSTSFGDSYLVKEFEFYMIGSSQSAAPYYNLNKINLSSPGFVYLSYEYLPMIISFMDYINDGYLIYLTPSFADVISSITISYDYAVRGAVEGEGEDLQINFLHYEGTTQPVLWLDYLQSIGSSQYRSQEYSLYHHEQTLGGENVYCINLLPGLGAPWRYNYNIYNYECTINFTGATNNWLDEYWCRMIWYSVFTSPPTLETNINAFDITNANWIETVARNVDSFLSIELIPNLSFYDIILMAIAIPLLIWILKAWLGG